MPREDKSSPAARELSSYIDIARAKAIDGIYGKNLVNPQVQLLTASSSAYTRTHAHTRLSYVIYDMQDLKQTSAFLNVAISSAAHTAATDF